MLFVLLGFQKRGLTVCVMVVVVLVRGYTRQARTGESKYRESIKEWIYKSGVTKIDNRIGYAEV